MPAVLSNGVVAVNAQAENGPSLFGDPDDPYER